MIILNGAGHSAQDSPDELNVPLPHSVQLLRHTFGASPGSHFSHPVLSLLLVLPASHVSQLTEPVFVANVPLPHVSQALPMLEDWPRPQGMQSSWSSDG